MFTSLFFSPSTVAAVEGIFYFGNVNFQNITSYDYTIENSEGIFYHFLQNFDNSTMRASFLRMSAFAS